MIAVYQWAAPIRCGAENLRECQRINSLDSRTKCKWLVKENEYMMLRDKDWEKIFTEIEKTPNAFGRYYKIVRAKMTDMDLVEMCVAFFVNDAFYRYSGELANGDFSEKG